MNPSSARFYFDYVDPLSYLVELELRAAETALGARVTRVPMELREPPEPMMDPQSATWARRVEEAAGQAARMGVHLAPQRMVPWTRKAHELVLHARTHGLGPAAHDALFESVFLGGLDIGRVDVLVDLAVSLGLDATGTKAALDVDRYAEDVSGARAAALAGGIHGVPSLVAGDHRLEGFHNRDALGTFLHASSTPDETSD
jgi:predicted DsbA family dithiol-disulfide isomerase